MKTRIIWLLKFYALTVFIFIAAKVVFMLCNDGKVADMPAVIRHGLSLDLSTSLYFLIVPFLVTMVSIWVKMPRWLLKPYYALLAVAFALAFVADTSLYPFWHFKLDASCLQYLETPTEAMASVTTGYLLVRLVAFLLVVALIYLAYDWISSSQTSNLKSQISNWIELLLYIVMIPLIVIGIRGGLDESTTNIGQVYFSQNQFLNHSAVNPVFSFLASFEKTASNNTVYHFMDDAQCQQIIDKLFTTTSVDSDALLNTQKPNIIVVLLEGCGGTFTEIGGRSDITPNLNRLAKEGVYFAQCYGNTWRTDRGTVCTWSGYPSFPTMSVMKIPSKSRTLPNMARTLSDSLGYSTYYLYGGDVNFTNMRSYLIGGGFETLKSKKDYTAEEQKTSQWGVCDGITFESLFEMASTAREPFVIGYSTLSSHQPWDVPMHHFDDEVLNAFYYLDDCLGRFVEKFRKSDRWKNTLLVLLPDHGIPYEDIGETHPLKNHIPMIWIGGAVKEARRIEQMCNQTDLPATLLGQLGIRHDDYTFSRDVLSKTYTKPCAIHTYDDGYLMYDTTSYVCYDFIGERVVGGEGNNQQQLMQWAKAILQAASNDLNER
jgi:phosphoglycerol transferase MdoB-like AlkP superfamily enzyme